MIAGTAGPRQPGPKYGQSIAPNLNVKQICPNCRNDPPNIIEEYSKGDLVCGDCGTILGDRVVDTRSEWRTFAGDENGDDPSRVGNSGNPLLADLFETNISSQDGRSGISRELQRAQARVSAATNGGTSAAALSAAFSKIAEKCQVMQLPSNVVMRAQHIYKIADDKKIVRGPRNQMAVIAACIILAGRDVGAERSFGEVLKVTRVHKKDFSQALEPVKHAMTEERLNSGRQMAGLASTEKSAEGLLARFINYLDLGNQVFTAAKHISAQATAKANIEGRNPVSIAGGVLYFTCVLFDKQISAKEISKVATITDSTIKFVCKKICEKLDDVIRPEWKTEYSKGYNQLLSMTVGGDSAKPSRAGTPKLSGSRSGTPSVEVPKPENGTPQPSNLGNNVADKHVNGETVASNGPE